MKLTTAQATALTVLCERREIRKGETDVRLVTLRALARRGLAELAESGDTWVARPTDASYTAAGITMPTQAAREAARSWLRTEPVISGFDRAEGAPQWWTDGDGTHVRTGSGHLAQVICDDGVVMASVFKTFPQKGEMRLLELWGGM